MHGHSWLFPGGWMTLVVWSIPVVIALAVLSLLFFGGSEPGGKPADPESGSSPDEMAAADNADDRLQPAGENSRLSERRQI